MSTLNALTVAVEVASRKRDEARRLLQEAQGAQHAAQDQLNQLQGYARETEGRWGMRADAAVQPEVMFHHYQFMDRLGHAAGVQTSVVSDHAARVQAARQALLAAELRLSSLRSSPGQFSAPEPMPLVTCCACCGRSTGRHDRLCRSVDWPASALW